MRMVTGPAGTSTRARNWSSCLGRSEGLEPSGNSDANKLKRASAVSAVGSVECMGPSTWVVSGRGGPDPGGKVRPDWRARVGAQSNVFSVPARLRGHDAEHQGADTERDVLAGVVMLVP